MQLESEMYGCAAYVEVLNRTAASEIKTNS